jgi:hypothetical protein
MRSVVVKQDWCVLQNSNPRHVAIGKQPLQNQVSGMVVATESLALLMKNIVSEF